MLQLELFVFLDGLQPARPHSQQKTGRRGEGGRGQSPGTWGPGGGLREVGERVPGPGGREED